MQSTYSRIFAALSPKRVYRRITSASARHILDQYFTVFLTFFFFFLFVLTMVIYQSVEEVKALHAKEVKNLSYWEGITTKYPTYPDGYYKAAVLAIRLRDNARALRYLNEALTLDPFFKEARELKKQVE
jgi:hypothetical protein